jgi:hypothetical protein
MKKITTVILIGLLGAFMCTACVTKKGNNNNLERDRAAAIDAVGRMDNALGN